MSSLFTPTFLPILFLFEVGSVLGIIYLIGLLVGNYASLPNKVPSHFGITGCPNAWGTKAFLWIFPVMGVFMYVMLTGIAINIPFNPQGYHGLARPLTPELLGQLNRATVLLMEVMKTEMIGMFLYLEVGTMKIARGEAEQLNGWVMPVFILGTFATIGLFVLYLKVVLQV